MPLDRWGRLLLRKHDYATTFGTPEGKRVLKDLLKFTGVMQNSFFPGAADTTAFHEGRRRVGIRILKIMRMSPEDMARIAELPEEADHGEV